MLPPPNKLRFSRKRPRFDNARGFAGLLVIMLLLVWAVGVVLAANGQRISDWWRLRGYTPPSAVVRLADQDTMNAYTRHLFYLNRPRLLDTVSGFRQYCPENKDTIVLGCYHPDQQGIFIYNVQDSALAGIQQVTAAHEVLHAVYARLSDHDRQNLNELLQNYYQHGLRDPRVQAEVKIYQRTEPTDVMDEMSCTFGTEIANLPEPLEAYYKRFFAKRAAIVAFEQQYEREFTSRQAAIDNDDRQLSTVKQQIDSREAALAAQLNSINAGRANLNSLLAAGQTGAYNAAVPGYNAQVDAYNNGLGELKDLINSYNQLVAARNLIAGQLTTLDKAIDTRLAPQTIR